MYAAVVTSDLEPAMTDADAAYEVNVRQEALDTNKVLILVAMLEVLPRDFYLIKLEESKFV